MLRRILIFTGYLVGTLFLIGLTFALVAYGNDYSYDFKTHKIIQNGHVILDSLPHNLKVTADGKLLKKKTPYQAAYKVGDHTFALEADGFWPWSKTLKVLAGQVTLAKYVTLVPKSPKTTSLDNPLPLVGQNISKDHRHLAYVTGGVGGALYTLDLGNPKPVKLYSAAPAKDATPAEALTTVAWSDDATHLLLTSKIGDANVQRLVPAAGGTVVNLTAQYGFDLSGLQFSANNWRQMYWISPDGLRRLDTGAQSVSAVLADKVTQFWPATDRVLYVQQNDQGRSLWSIDGGGHHQQLIPALPLSDSYNLAYTNWQGEDELALVPASSQIGTLYSGIFGDTPVAKTIARNVTGASFSPDGHMLAFTSPTQMVTYDLDQSKLFDQLVSYAITDQPGTMTAFSWFDNYHFLTTRDGKLFWSEYDGNNRIELGAAAGGWPGYSTSDTRWIVNFKPEGANTRVQEWLIKP